MNLHSIGNNLKGLGSLPKEERPKVGKLANQVKVKIEHAMYVKGSASLSRG